MQTIFFRSRLARTAAFATILTAAPLAISPTRGIVLNEARAACNDGSDASETCCAQKYWTCAVGREVYADFYYLEGGGMCP
jgi:hypothetical protein